MLAIFQYEHIRRIGAVNMFDFHGVQSIATQLDYYELADLESFREYSSLLSNYPVEIQNLPSCHLLSISHEGGINGLSAEVLVNLPGFHSVHNDGEGLPYIRFEFSTGMISEINLIPRRYTEILDLTRASVA